MKESSPLARTDRVVFDAVFLGPRYQNGQQVNAVADDLLGSLRVKPQALVDTGFTFDHPDLASVLDAALHH